MKPATKGWCKLWFRRVLGVLLVVLLLFLGVVAYANFTAIWASRGRLFTDASALPATKVGYATGLPADLAESFTITVAGDNVQDETRVASFAMTDTTTFNIGDVPAIALTAYARAEDRVKALRSGFQMHVAKPVEPAELIAIVANLAGRMRKPDRDDTE